MKDTNKDHRKISREKKSLPSIKEVRRRCTKQNKPDCLSRKISYYITPIFLNTSITPNEVSLFWLMLVITAPFLFLFNNYYMNLIAAFLFLSAYILDAVDGNIARYKEIFSPKAELLDSVAFWIWMILSGFILGWINYQESNNIWFLIAGAGFVFNFVLDELVVQHGQIMKLSTQEKNTHKEKGKVYKKYLLLKKVLLWNPNKLVWFFLISIVIDLPVIFFAFYGVSLFIHWSGRLIHDIVKYFL